MIADLHPYPDMRSTGLPWLPSLPAHWDVRRNGRLFGQRRETGFPDLPVLEVSLRTGVRVRDFKGGGRKQAIADRSKYQRAAQGDIAYNMMRMWQGAVGIAPTDGLVSPAYVVATPYPEAEAAYYAYLFRTATYMHEVESYSRGIVPDRNRLYWEAFKQMPSAYPPIDEQQLIVRFLDWHGAMTARLIRAKERLIALLLEERSRIIDHAISPAENWEIKRLRNVAKVLISNVDKKINSGENPIRLCNYVDVYKNDIIHSELPFMKATASLEEIKRFKLRNGDVVITKDSEDWKDIGVPALVKFEAEDFVCAYHLAVLRPRASVVTGDFLYWQLLGPTAKLQLSLEAKGITRYGLSLGGIKAAPVFLPSLEVQKAIVDHLVQATAQINATIAHAKSEITFIQEFRTRLISDVVTGQLDVRAAAAALPDTASSDDDDIIVACESAEVDEDLAA